MKEQNPMLPETRELIETHQKLMLNYATELTVREEDAYSLAQPSPFRFVPTIVSNQTAPINPGD